MIEEPTVNATRTPLAVWLFALALAIGGSAGAAQAQDAGWKAGVARAVITPETGVWLAGYGTKRPPDGKLHDLWMKALALEDPNYHRSFIP